MQRRVLEFNGKDNWVEIPGHPQHRLDVFTIEAWVQGGNFRKHAGIVGSVGHAGGAFSGFGLYFDAAPGRDRRLVVGVAPAAAPAALASATSAATVPAASGWRHVAATYDGATARLLLDGVEVGSRALAASPLRHAPDARLILGMFQGDLAQPVVFEGCMAEVRLWRTARTPAQILEEMRCMLWPDEHPDLVGYWPLDEEPGARISDLSAAAAHGAVRYAPRWVTRDLPMHAPALRVTPGAPHDFGTLADGAPPAAQTFTLENAGQCRLRVTRVTLDDPDDFTLAPVAGLPRVLRVPPDRLEVTVTAAPRNPGTARATLTIAYQLPRVPGDLRFPAELRHDHPLQATRTAPPPRPRLAVTDPDGALAGGDARDLGGVVVGQSVERTFTLTNTGTGPLTITALDLDPEGELARANLPALPATLAPGASLALAVRLAPTAVGERAATLTIASDDPERPRAAIALTGRGLAAPKPPPHRVTAVGHRVTFYRGVSAVVCRADGTLWHREARSPWQQVPDMFDVQAVSAPRKGSGAINQLFALLGDGGLWALNAITGSRAKVLDGVVDVSAGYNHVLALREDGAVFGLGENLFGQRGGQGADPRAWVDVGVRGATRVVAGWQVSAAHMRDGSVWCWGINNPHVAQARQVAPTQVPIAGVAAVAAIGCMSLPIVAAATWDGQVLLWTGADGSPGARGSWSFRVQGQPRTIDVDLYSDGPEPTTFVVTHDGRLWSWGRNRHGQAGRRPTGHPLAADLVPGLPPVVEVAIAGYWSIALDAQGHAWEWGGACFEPRSDPSIPRRST
jgi:hypothetical protein